MQEKFCNTLESNILSPKDVAQFFDIFETYFTCNGDTVLIYLRNRICCWTLFSLQQVGWKGVKESLFYPNNIWWVVFRDNESVIIRSSTWCFDFGYFKTVGNSSLVWFIVYWFNCGWVWSHYTLQLLLSVQFRFYLVLTRNSTWQYECCTYLR